MGTEQAIIDGLLDRFEARIDDARQFALRNRVALLRAANGEHAGRLGEHAGRLGHGS